MKMKNILLTYLAVLTLSFSVFAVEVQEEAKITTQDKIELNRQNSPLTRLATENANSHAIPQASAEKPSELMTALSVYLIIIVVYSIYGMKANSKNAGN